MKQIFRTWVFQCCLLAVVAGGGPAVFADTIITKSGQTLEGVIKDENQFNVRLDNRGNMISVPKTRIKSITKKTPDENVKLLLDRAMEAVKRMDVTSARAYVEQAQALNASNQEIRLQIENVNKKIQEMEIRGGTKEEQQMRAQTLLDRAKEAYDMIKNEEGNRLLLQALQTDPSFEKAHEMINSRLVRDNGSRGQGNRGAKAGAGGAESRKNEPQMSTESGDILLAANYFTRVVWPNNEVFSGKADSPLIKLLPRIYGTLSGLFDESADPENAVEYAKLLEKLAEAFAAHPAWKETGDVKLKAVIDKPVDSLLAEMVKKNVDKGSYELALRKMKGWTTPDANLEICQIYMRALEGAEQYAEATALLEKAIAKFPDQTSLRPRFRALKMLVESQQLEKSDRAAAIASYESIYATRDNLSPEIGDTVGRQLARLKGPDMDPSAASGQIWRAADIAAIVMQYGQDQAMRRHAAELIIKSLRDLPWKLDLVWSINGTTMPLTDEIIKMAQDRLKADLSVVFDQSSPFVIHLTVDAITSGETAPVVEALRTGQTLAKPVAVSDFHFTLEVSHITLGSLYKSTWKKADVPQAAIPVTEAAPPATPAPSPTPAAGVKPAAGATPAPTAKPATTPKPTPTPAATLVANVTPPAAKAGATPAPAAPVKTLPGFPLPPSGGGAAGKAAGSQGAVAATPGALLMINSMDSIKSFVDKRLLGYVKAWPKVTVLTSHLSVPKAQELLTKE